MRIFKRQAGYTPGLQCPACRGTKLGLGYVDRVRCTVLHSCGDCGVQWRDDFIDLAERQLAEARAGR